MSRFDFDYQWWMDSAACTSEDVDPQWFDFQLDLGDGVHEKRADRNTRHERAALVCVGCGVLEACSAWADSNRIEGVLGGTLWALTVPPGESRRRTIGKRAERAA